jgi:hypothetical protein
MLDWQSSRMTIAASGMAAVIGGPIWAAIAAGLGTALQFGTSIAEARIKSQDVARGANREVAILYDINQRFS